MRASCLAGAGLLFVERVSEAVLFALFVLVLLEVPGEADGELGTADVECLRAGFACGGARVADGCYPDLGDIAAISILLVPLDANILAHHGTGQALLRAVTERLSFFRGIDTGETNFVLLAICIKHGNRIAIGNPDHATGKRFSLNRTR